MGQLLEGDTTDDLVLLLIFREAADVAAKTGAPAVTQQIKAKAAQKFADTEQVSEVAVMYKVFVEQL